MPVCPRYRSSCRLVADRETIPKRASGKLARSVTKAAGAEPLLAIAHGLMDHGQTGSRPWRRPRHSAPSLPTRPDELGEPKRESALSTGGSKGVLTPRLQVNELNAQEIRAFASQPGMASGQRLLRHGADRLSLNPPQCEEQCERLDGAPNLTRFLCRSTVSPTFFRR